MKDARAAHAANTQQPFWLSLVAIAREAGAIQMRYFRSGAEVTLKADASPVTVADQESEVLILERLRALAPGVPVVAEEETAAGRLPPVGARFFLVDPLDGTKEFIAGRPEFTVNIAVVENSRPVAGVVFAPATGQLYATTDAGGAVAAEVGDTAGDELRFRPIRTRPPDRQHLVAVASRSHMNIETQRFLDRFMVTDMRQAGSSLKFCAIAEGLADIYPRIGATNEWDTAAGHAVLDAAGGCVTRLDGSPLDYGKAAALFRNPDYVAWGAPTFP